jgi:hypothetical protein
MRFDDARHWVPIYRTRFGPNAPAIQMRVCASFHEAASISLGDAIPLTTLPAK